ncbi:unnamed protein product, partial [Effrenium voratum]
GAVEAEESWKQEMVSECSSTSAVSSQDSKENARNSGSSWAKAKRMATRKKIIKSTGDNSVTSVWVQRVVYSMGYEVYSALLILLNAVFVGWQTEWTAATVHVPSSELGFEPTFFY